MASTINELTIEYEEEGVTLVKELAKVVLSKGAWTTIIYQYEEWNNKKECYGPPKYSIRRYQKRNNEYKQKSKFNISSDDQARQIIAALTEWTNQKSEIRNQKSEES